MSHMLASFLIIIGPFVGSFIAVLTVRWSRGEGFVLGRSRCEGCGHALGGLEMVPVLSAVVLRWRCRGCGGRFSKRDTVIELAALGIAIWAFFALPGDLLVVGVLLGWGLLVLAIIDFENFILPDLGILIILVGGITVSFFWYPERLNEIAIGVFVGAGGMWLVRWLYRQLRGQEGVGFGDVKLMGAIGAWVGWQGLGSVILIAAITGLVVHVVVLGKGRQTSRHNMVPFGSYLVLACWIVWLHGPLVTG
ncbi:A24 family peptidase [Thalassospira sp.]|uniref:prepilin peptidase n=1 Tax=Thalassospira sp. TaxID=1912094 RepID=UPI0032ED8C3A